MQTDTITLARAFCVTRIFKVYRGGEKVNMHAFWQGALCSSMSTLHAVSSRIIDGFECPQLRCKPEVEGVPTHLRTFKSAHYSWRYSMKRRHQWTQRYLPESVYAYFFATTVLIGFLLCRKMIARKWHWRKGVRRGLPWKTQKFVPKRE